MPSIADQVSTLEHDHAAALAQIDALTAANAALSSANTSLQTENAALQAAVSDMNHYVASTRSMAEELANSALDMLRASRRQVSAPAEATKPRSDGEKLLALVADPEGQAAVTAIMAGDSGDETEIHARKIDEQDAGNANAVSIDDNGTRTTVLPANELRVATGPMIVDHVDNLPIFLQRDTPFDRQTQAFG